MFMLLPQHLDKNGINYSDYQLRTKFINKKSSELPHPELTLQFIDKSNRIIFTSLWNEVNVNSFCQILLKIHDEIVNNKSK